MEPISRHLKGIFAPTAINDTSVQVRRSQCLTLQHYEFDCQRDRDTRGKPYGSVLPTTISFTVRVINNDDCRIFYQWLVDRQQHDFSLVFNADYDQYQYVANYDAALVATGYLVDIDEKFKSWDGTSHENQQMTITMRVLLSGIRFIGESGDKTLEIIH